MKKIPKLIILIVLVNGLISCAQKIHGIEYGQLNGTVYGNKQFNLAIEIPENWYYIDKENKQFLAKQNIREIYKDQPDSEQIVKRSTENTTLIFTIFKYKPDTLIEVNPHITITATDISKTPNLKNLEYTIEQIKEGFKEINSAFQFENEIIETAINDKIYKGYQSSITINGMSANYESFLGNFGNYNLLMTISFKDEDQKAELKGIIEKIKELK